MSIFILFVRVGVLFESAFSLWVSLNKLRVVCRKGLFFSMANHGDTNQCSSIIFLSWFFNGKGAPPNLSQIWVKKILSLSKVRGVITESMLLLKYKKQVITAALNGEDTPMFLHTVSKKSWI